MLVTKVPVCNNQSSALDDAMQLSDYKRITKWRKQDGMIWTKNLDKNENNQRVKVQGLYADEIN